jgi:hypothetical protein
MFRNHGLQVIAVILMVMLLAEISVGIGIFEVELDPPTRSRGTGTAVSSRMQLRSRLKASWQMITEFPEGRIWECRYSNWNSFRRTLKVLLSALTCEKEPANRRGSVPECRL